METKKEYDEKKPEKGQREAEKQEGNKKNTY